MVDSNISFNYGPVLIQCDYGGPSLRIKSAARREQGKISAAVYGIASDGVGFRFYRVDNEGKFSQLRNACIEI